MTGFKKRKWVIAAQIFIALFLVIQVGRHFFRDQERQARHFIYTSVKRTFPKAVQGLAKTQGLKPFIMGSFPFVGKSLGIVILIHGLDDPGLVWMNLAPALYEKGYTVLIMTYPNDQPIKASSKFFFQEMTSHFQGKNREVSIVAHSMGGLIARDVLTDPLFAYSQKAEQRKVPRVKQLIMVGTPNHGSELAQFRVFTEIRDQFHQFFKPETHWLNSFLDGAGEAGIDLLPGSRFLVALNLRPLPENIRLHIIAGSFSPWFKEAIGDGLVPVASARLFQVPLTIVPGTHLTMIRNISTSSRRIPPAVPLILKLLAPE